ncbi:MAG: ribose 5-phosphate isomerase B [Bryobacteraceae bacterium]
MKIAIGADHAGFFLKEKLRDWLRAEGHEVDDLGAASAEPADYPDFAEAVSRDVISGKAERGILVCSTGVGMSIAANKVPGIRAALAVNPEEVRLTRAHNDANVLTLGARYIDAPAAETLIGIFLQTGFDGGRHQRRVSKIAELEKEAKNPE